MVSRTVTEIVNTEMNQKQVDEIMQQFIDTQKNKYKKIVDENSPQYQNIKILAQLLCCHNNETTTIPIVANVPMGQGKSSLLVEFIRFMHRYDKDFGAVVVKKTIDECKDFAIDTGIVEVEDFKEYEELFLIEPIEQRKLYDEKESYFKTMVVRGFNFEDCVKYKDKSRIFGKAPSDAVDYDYRLCSGCPVTKCTVRQSKWRCQDHRIVAITHTRLFLSTDVDELINSIMYFKNENGDLIRRNLLIIDEKMEMCDIESLTLNQFNRLKLIIDENYSDYKKLFGDIHEYLEKLTYPEDSTADIIEQNEFFSDSTFEFDDKLRQEFYLNKTIEREQYEQLLTLEKILNSKNITTSIQYKHGASKKKNNLIKQISTYKYIDLAFYHKHFEKSIILDATAKLDNDYRNSNIVFCNEIIQCPPKIDIHMPTLDFNASKSKLIGTSSHLTKKEEIIEYYNSNIESLAMECKNIIDRENEKVLIVVYKNIQGIIEFNMKMDIKSCLRRLKVDEKMYRLIHHGEYSTGVNHLSDYNSIIIIGQLNKSSSYYQNKSLSLDIPFLSRKQLKNEAIDPVQLNDYLITNIQQIGGTSLRKGQTPAIYLLHKKNEAACLLTFFNQYFEVNRNDYVNRYYDTTPKKRGRNKNGYDKSNRPKAHVIKLKEYLLSLPLGEYKRKHIQNQMEIKDDGQFSKIVQEVKEYLGAEGIEHIEFKGHSVIISAIKS